MLIEIEKEKVKIEERREKIQQINDQLANESKFFIKNYQVIF